MRQVNQILLAGNKWFVVNTYWCHLCFFQNHITAFNEPKTDQILRILLYHNGRVEILRAKINGNSFGSSQCICVLVIFIVSSQVRWVLFNLVGLANFFVFKSTSLSSNQLLRVLVNSCLLYTSPSPRDLSTSRMPSSA